MVEIVSADKAVKSFNIKDGKIVALAKDGTLVLDVKDSKAKAKTAYDNVAIYNEKGEVAQTITAQDNSVVITAEIN